MNNKIFFFLVDYGVVFIFVLFGIIEILYYGIYAYLGNEVINRINGGVVLSKEVAVGNVLFGVFIIGYVMYKFVYKEKKE